MFNKNLPTFGGDILTLLQTFSFLLKLEVWPVGSLSNRACILRTAKLGRPNYGLDFSSILTQKLCDNKTEYVHKLLCTVCHQSIVFRSIPKMKRGLM